MVRLKKEIKENDYYLIEKVRMKKIIFIFITIAFISCSEKPVPKPDNLLSKEEMENIIYDISILQAAEAYKPEILGTNSLYVKEYVFKKYNIDSTIYFQNYKYYAADIRVFKKLYKNVNNRLEEKKSIIDTLLKSNKIELPKKSPIYNPQIK